MKSLLVCLSVCVCLCERACARACVFSWGEMERCGEMGERKRGMVAFCG
jgi:hypothetical protein